MQSLLIIGGGQLAQALARLRPDAVVLQRAQCDLEQAGQVRGVLERYTPDAVINAAAYTQVDKAESEEALAVAVNAQAPAVMAAYCKERDIPFVHFSTDYVFDGTGLRPWREDDKTSPLNAYGRSKRAGEEAVARVGGKYLIFRTSWVYDETGKNFMNTILRLAAEREELRVIDDQYGAPTYARHLAHVSLAALEKACALADFPAGIYHACNAGVTTWHGFATRIVELARAKGLPVKINIVHPIPATDYPLPAPRPYNSRLDCSKLLDKLGISFPSWEEGLAECLENKLRY